MRTVPKIALSFVLCAAAVGYVSRGRFADMYVRHAGRVTPHGTSSETYQRRPVRVVAIIGDRWVSPTVSVPSTAFAAVLHFAGDSLVHVASEAGNDGYRGWMTDRWTLTRPLGGGMATGAVEFSARYDALTNTALIDGRAYSLDAGNLFDVRLDRGSRPVVRQLHTTLVADRPGGREVKALTGPPPPAPPCPRKPTPPRDAGPAAGQAAKHGFRTVRARHASRPHALPR